MRFVSIEIVWKKTQSLSIPLNGLKYNQDKDYYYVIALKYGEYVKIPIKVLLSNESMALIDNLEDEEFENLGLKKEYTIKLYDRIILE